jgi:polysaccharide biosynthesis/export protein
MRSFVVGVVAAAVCWLVISVPQGAAQPIEDPPPVDGRGTGGTTKIPIVLPNGTEVLGAETSATTSAAAPISLEEPIDPTKYVCGPGDVFELNFWGQQNFRLRIAADLEGRAFISKVGFVAVSGKTLTTVRKDVQKKVRGNYPGLNFELTLVSPRSFGIHVVDNVKQPGRYTAHAVERVSAIIARAGGATGSRRRIQIRRPNGDVQVADLVMYELTGDTRYNPFVLDGDVISVPFPLVKVAISGAVRRPGSYELVKSKDLRELIELAGGISSSAARSLPLRIVRRDASEHSKYIEVALAADSTVPAVELRDDDEVQVREAEELQRTVLLIGAVVGADSIDTATTSKRLAFVDGDTVLSLINRAGGIKAPGDLKASYISRAQAKGAPPVQIPIDLEALLVRKDLSADKRVLIGDTIVIPPRQYSILVEGAVARGGMYPFNPQFGIAEYIAHAGGRTRTARDLDEVKLIDWSGKTHDYRPGMTLSPGDAILVPERNFTRAEIASLVLAGASLVLSGITVAYAVSR